MEEPKDQFDILQSSLRRLKNSCRTGWSEPVKLWISYHPKVLYFDWWIQHSALRPYLRKAAAYYYDRMNELGERRRYKL
jgi:alpha-L-fucosidase